MLEGTLKAPDHVDFGLEARSKLFGAKINFELSGLSPEDFLRDSDSAFVAYQAVILGRLAVAELSLDKFREYCTQNFGFVNERSLGLAVFSLMNSYGVELKTQG